MNYWNVSTRRVEDVKSQIHKYTHIGGNMHRHATAKVENV